ncbi:MAG: FAD-dependent oxidoreductase [Actinomycetota bacterium]
MNVVEPGPKSRSEALQRLSEESFDVLVVGGGITGAGVALDAARRDLSVALIEKADFSAGTSSKSTKLVHGGLRYLEQRELGLVREALRERDLLRRMLPHLVTPIPLLWSPLQVGRAKAAGGLRLYDVLASSGSFDRHRWAGGDEVGWLAPGLRGGSGAYLVHEGLTDDSRLVLSVLREARRAGAVVCNHLGADAFLEARGRLAGCVGRDGIGGEAIEVRAATIVNATGVWADEVSGLETSGKSRLRPSKGIHLILSRRALPLKSGVLMPAADGRTVMAIPWRSSILVGTTDAPYEGRLDSPSVTAGEAAYILDALSASFDREIGPSDLCGATAGIRPLLLGAAGAATRDLSRRHAIWRGPRGLVTVTGGKLTTFRRMAEETMELVAGAGAPSPMPAPGGDLQALRHSMAARLKKLDLSPEIGDSLLRSYGSDALAVLDLGREMELVRPIAPGLPYLMAELVWGVREEMAMTVADLLARRTRLSLEDLAGGVRDEQELPALLGAELGVSSREIARQVSEYRLAVTRERGPAVPAPATVTPRPEGARSRAGLALRLRRRLSH